MLALSAEDSGLLLSRVFGCCSLITLPLQLVLVVEEDDGLSLLLFDGFRDVVRAHRVSRNLHCFHEILLTEKLSVLLLPGSKTH